MSHKLANGMKMWKEIGNTTLLFSPKGLEILHQERRGQVKTIVMEHFNGILFRKSRPAYKQHTNESISARWVQGCRESVIGVVVTSSIRSGIARDEKFCKIDIFENVLLQ